MMSWLEHRIGDYFLGLNSDAHSDESALPLASLFLLPPPFLSLSPSLSHRSVPPTTRTVVEAAGFFSSVAGAASFRCPLRLHIFDLSPTLPSVDLVSLNPRRQFVADFSSRSVL
ncbi:hypothetical protein BHM03_00017004 [Ensete ventricosum]|nr:hypothetical protein BHM03_00017004 [Ensete ventricosum]